jgi:hypothetical protein
MEEFGEDAEVEFVWVGGVEDTSGVGYVKAVDETRSGDPHKESWWSVVVGGDLGRVSEIKGTRLDWSLMDLWHVVSSAISGN